MKKRILSLLLSVVMLTALLGITPAAAENTAAAAEALYYTWDFNGDLSATTNDPEGIALTRADSNELEQAWGDGTIKFDKDIAVNQYYQLSKPLTLSHDKAWSIEWKGSILQSTDGTKVFSTLLSDTSGKHYLHMTRKEGYIRYSAEQNYEVGVMKNDNVHTYKLANVPDGSGKMNAYISFDGAEWQTLKISTKNSDGTFTYPASVDINSVFGFGTNVNYQYKGEVDYLTITLDGQTAADYNEKLAGKAISVSGGSGTAADPYTGSVVLPYTANTVDSSLVGNSNEVVSFYTDNTFATAAESVDTTGLVSKNINFSVFGVYYSVDASFAVDLNYDSAKYMFDFNNSFETSEGGLYNKLTPTLTSAYASDEAAIAATEYAFQDDGTIFFTPYNKGNKAYTEGTNYSSSLTSARTYELAAPIVLNQQTNWKIIAKLTNRNKLSQIVPGEMAIFDNRVQYMNWAEYDSSTNKTTSGKRKSSGVNVTGANAELVYENNPLSDGTREVSYTITANNNVNTGTFATTVTEKTDTDGNAYTVTESCYTKDTTVERLFNSDKNGNQAFREIVDYVYIDTNVYQTSAMEFLNEYGKAIYAAEVNSENMQATLEMLEAYKELTDDSKEYLTRGENDKIAALSAQLNSYIVTSIAGVTVSFVGGTGAQSNPVEYTVTLPYSKTELTAADFTTLVSDGTVALYETDAYAAATEAVSLEGSYSHTVYVKVNDTYVKAVVTSEVDLSVDSAEYKFDFNGTLETSADGAYNKLTPTLITDVTDEGKVATEYTFTEDGNIKFSPYSASNTYVDGEVQYSGSSRSSRTYELETPIVIAPDVNWKITAGYHNLQALSTVVPDVFAVFDRRVQYMNAKKVTNDTKTEGSRIAGTPYDGNTDGLITYNAYNNVIIENVLDKNGNQTVEFERKNPSNGWTTIGEFVSPKTSTDSNGNTIVTSYKDTVVNVSRLFNSNVAGHQAFRGNVDYVYIDTNVSKSDAMKYLAEYKAVFTGSADEALQAAAVTDYFALSDEAKAYLVRGEADKINSLKALVTGTVLYSKERNVVYITSIGADLANAKLLLCTYASSKLTDIEPIEVNAEADDILAIELPVDYTVSGNIKAILVDGYENIKPLCDVILVK